MHGAGLGRVPYPCAMDSEPYREEEAGEFCVGDVEVNNNSEVEGEFIQQNVSLNVSRVDREDINRKRSRTNRQSSSEEEWNTVTRGRKIIRTGSCEVEEKIQVIVSSTTALPKQFTLAKVFKQYDICGINRVKYLHNFKILITFETERDADKLFKCKELLDLGWRPQRSLEVGISYGVIKNIDIDVTEEEIVKNLVCSSDIEVLSARRLNKRKQDGQTGWVKCEAVRLAFKGASLPSYVYIFGLRTLVTPYIFPVTQCSKCWKYGHTRLLCPSTKVVCPKCTKNHENCEIIKYTCINCRGDHMALQKICPVYKKERRIRELMAEFNCTYRKALTMYVPPTPNPSPVSCPASTVHTNEIIAEIYRGPEINPSRIEISKSATSITENEVQSRPSSQHRSYKEVLVRKNRKQKETASVEFTSPSSSSIEGMDISGDKMQSDCLDGNIHDSEPKKSRERNIEDSSFIRFIVKIYKIIMSNNSLQEKIYRIVIFCKEWILANVLNYLSADSFLNIFNNFK